jgi:Lipase (class 3)
MMEAIMPLAPGFDLTEALDLVTFCGNIEHPNALPIPAGWSLIFDSPEFSQFNEKWQLWKQNDSDTYAIVIRGTVFEVGSILEDLISFLTLATGSVTVGPSRIDYKFAANSHSAVHVGFALGTLMLLKEPENGILAQLAANVPANSQVYITGHSQGAAVATL